MWGHALQSEHATTIGIDQHARLVTLATLELANSETRSGRLADCPFAELIVEWTKWVTKPLSFVYESGRRGFQLAREIRAMGVGCDVIAVTSVPRGTEARRLKVDREDAQSPPGVVTA